MSRSNRTLRQANAAYRALRQETQALVRRAETALITAIILYKLLTELVFLPAMRGIWSLTLRVFAGELPDEHQCTPDLYGPQHSGRHRAHRHSGGALEPV